jgi:hypothetical protein
VVVHTVLRSQNIPPVVSLLFKPCEILFNDLKIALSVEKFDLKPDWSFDKLLLSVKSNRLVLY